MLRNLAIALSLLSALPSCKEVIVDLPPPVSRGKCLAARYVGALAVDQTCQMDGYSWHCETSAGQPIGCVRGPELGELPPAKAPPVAAAPTPPAAGSAAP